MSLPHALVPSHYDPLGVFLDIFDNDLVALHIAPVLNCYEVNALAGLLASAGRHDGARTWRLHHRELACDEPSRH